MECWVTLHQRATERVAETQQKAQHLLLGPQNPRESTYEMALAAFYSLLNNEIATEEIHIKTHSITDKLYKAYSL